MKKYSHFQKQMISMIKKNYYNILGDDVKLLDKPSGLDIVIDRINKGHYK